VRESLVFQVKLVVDGLRDFMLVPIALVATLVGLLRGGEDPAREFRRVLDLGRQSEQWINLFGQHEPIQEAGRAGSIDLLLTHAEQVLREQARAGGVSEGASRAIAAALQKAHSSVRDDEQRDVAKDQPDCGGDQ
jgi:hypothetical protein